MSVHRKSPRSIRHVAASSPPRRFSFASSSASSARLKQLGEGGDEQASPVSHSSSILRPSLHRFSLPSSRQAQTTLVIPDKNHLPKERRRPKSSYLSKGASGIAHHGLNPSPPDSVPNTFIDRKKPDPSFTRLYHHEASLPGKIRSRDRTIYITPKKSISWKSISCGPSVVGEPREPQQESSSASSVTLRQLSPSLRARELITQRPLSVLPHTPSPLKIAELKPVRWIAWDRIAEDALYFVEYIVTVVVLLPVVFLFYIVKLGELPVRLATACTVVKGHWKVVLQRAVREGLRFEFRALGHLQNLRRRVGSCAILSSPRSFKKQAQKRAVDRSQVQRGRTFIRDDDNTVSTATNYPVVD